jgi:hypothetical protein
MKKSYRPIIKIFGIVLLLTFLFTPVVSAQPATQYLNILGSAFKPVSTTQTFDTNAGCIYSTGGTDGFNSPVLLPRGSLIKFVEFFYYDTNPATITSLKLYKTDPLADPTTSTILVTLSTQVNTGKAKRISAELNITVETDCSVDPQCFYTLGWGSPTAGDTQRLCGARIHYIPPFGAVALPLIKKD